MKTEFYNKLVCTEGMSKLDWLKWRQKGIGGSDIASVCGINPWKSGLALYYDKTEKIKEDEEENIPAELGTFLEPFMKVKFEKWLRRTEHVKIEVEKIPYILQHPDNPIALANVDGVFDNHFPLQPEIYNTCLVEYKTTSERNYKEWQKDNLPDYYYLQTQWYLYITNYRFCYLAFLIGNKKFDVKLIERNDEVIKLLVDKVDYFWNTFVILKTPPAPDSSSSSSKTLDLMYPKEITGKEITIEEEEYKNYLKDYDNLGLKFKEVKLEIEKCKQMFKAKMRDASTAYCGDKKIVWQEQVRAEHIVKESKFRMFKIYNYKGDK